MGISKAKSRRNNRIARIGDWVANIDMLKAIWKDGGFTGPIGCRCRLARNNRIYSLQPFRVEDPASVDLALLWIAYNAPNSQALGIPAILFVNDKTYLHSFRAVSRDLVKSLYRIETDTLVEIDFRLGDC